MTDKQTVPPDFEEYAIEQARRIAAIDRCRLPGSDAQFKAIVQIAIADAMMFAAELRRRPHITIHSNRIELSPAMQLSDHEMDVLRSLASRIKDRERSQAAEPRVQLALHTHVGADV